MIDKLYFYYWKTPATFYSMDLGLKNLCKQNNIQYQAIAFQKCANALDIDIMPATMDKIAVVFFNDYNRGRSHFDMLRSKCPNSIAIQIGSDSQYQGYGDISLPDFHLDLMEEYVDKARNEGTNAELLWWTVSKEICKFISEHSSYKPWHFICLCNENCTLERRRFFYNMRFIKNYLVQGDIKWFHIQKLLQVYTLSKTTLGITHSPHDGNKARGMKGFRDWLGPLCGSPLIYDDHPQMVKHFKGIVPFYKFNEVESIPDALNEIDSRTLERQRNWIENNFIEQQLQRIFAKWGII